MPRRPHTQLWRCCKFVNVATPWPMDDTSTMPWQYLKFMWRCCRFVNSATPWPMDDILGCIYESAAPILFRENRRWPCLSKRQILRQNCIIVLLGLNRKLRVDPVAVLGFRGSTSFKDRGGAAALHVFRQSISNLARPLTRKEQHSHRRRDHECHGATSRFRRPSSHESALSRTA